MSDEHTTPATQGDEAVGPVPANWGVKPTQPVPSWGSPQESSGPTQQPPPLPSWVGSPPQGAPTPGTTTATATPMSSQPATFTVKRRTSRMSKAASVAALGLIVALGVSTISFRSQNEKTSQQLASTTANLDTTRTKLDETVTALDDTKSKLAAETSRADDLDQRVAELSNEKAKVQDERNASQELARLGAVAAQQMLDCRNKLLDVMSLMLDSSYIVVSARMEAIVPVCQEANSAVAAFSDATG